MSKPDIDSVGCSSQPVQPVLKPPGHLARDLENRRAPARHPIPFPDLLDQFRGRRTAPPHFFEIGLHVLQAIGASHGHEENGCDSL